MLTTNKVSNKSKYTQSIFSAMKAAIPILLADYSNVSRVNISKKGLKDFVSETDVKVESILIEQLYNEFPDFGFLVEENSSVNDLANRCEYRWIIDAIDGTFNFIHQLPSFCISIALERKIDNHSEIIAAVIAAPAINEFYWAEKGAGAYCISQGNENRIQVSNSLNYEELLVFINFIENADTSQKETMIRTIIQNKSQIRVLGSAVLEMAYLACGKSNMVLLDDLQPWDIAAGMLMIKEASGVTLNFKEDNLTIYDKNVFATYPALYKKIKNFDFFK